MANLRVTDFSRPRVNATQRALAAPGRMALVAAAATLCGVGTLANLMACTGSRKQPVAVQHPAAALPCPPTPQVSKSRTSKPGTQATEPQRSAEVSAPPLADPRRAAYLPPVRGQLPRRLREPPASTGDSAQPSRWQVTVQPVFGAVHLALRERPSPLRGIGAMVQSDLHLYRGLYISAFAQRTVHPLREIANVDVENEKVTILAPKGRLHADSINAGFLYLIDFGRVTPMLDLGGGALWLSTPKGAIAGQRGNACQNQGTCDPGLRCNVEKNVCEIYPEGTLHFGLGFDVRLGRHWSLGLHTRYFAIWRQPGQLPVHLSAGLRVTFRY